MVLIPTYSTSSSGMLPQAHMGGLVVISPRSEADSTVSQSVARHAIPLSLVIPVDGLAHRIHESLTKVSVAEMEGNGVLFQQTDVTSTAT